MYRIPSSIYNLKCAQKINGKAKIQLINILNSAYFQPLGKQGDKQV